MDFLYFPEDKSEYIPGLIFLAIVIAGAVLTMYLINKASKKEEKKVAQKYNQEKDVNPEEDKKN